MAIAPVLNCQFPQDLEAAAKALEQEIGDRFINSMKLIKKVESAAAGIPEGIAAASNTLTQIMASGAAASNTLTQIMASGGSLKKPADVSEQFGLPKDPSDPTVDSDLEDEKMLFHVGAVYVDGVIYIPGKKSNVAGDRTNIEVLRRLYFAYDRDLDKVAEAVKSSKTLIVHNLADVRVIPPKIVNKEAYTLAEVRTITGASYLNSSDIYLSEGLYTYAMIKGKLLGVNLSIAETQKNNSLKSNEITTSVFHIGKVDNSSSSISNYSKLGYQGDYLSVILIGQDLDEVFPEVVDHKLSQNKLVANNIIAKLEFILGRYGLLPDLNDTRDKIVADITSLRASHLGMISDAHFQVIIVQQTDTLEKLRDVHSDAVITKLLEQRPEVKGIFFDAPDKAIFQLIKDTTQAAPGSTMVSNGFLTRDVEENYNTNTFLKMAADLHAAQLAIENISPPQRSDFQICLNKLTDFTGGFPKLNSASYVNPNGTLGNPKNPKDIYQGQPSAASPGGVFATTMDPDRTFRLKLRLGVIDDLISKMGELFEEFIAKPLAQIIRLIAKLFKAAMAACKLIQDTLKNLILPIKRTIDAFMSQFLSLTGSGVFESSLLKCAVNFDIGLSTSLLDDLLAIIDQVAALISGFIAALVEFVADFIQSFLCLPINMINAFIGQISVSLPSFCSVPSLSLGDTLTSALEDLRAVADLKQVAMSSFSGDLIKFRAMIGSAPDKVVSFKSGGICNSGGVAGFFGAAALNLGGGF